MKITKTTSLIGQFWLDLDVNQTLSIAINDYEIIEMEEEYLDVVNFLSNEINFTLGEKILMAFEWILLETLANGLIFGMVQYERLGADPMKRRLTDQVRQGSLNLMSLLVDQCSCLLST